jgi:hypothetical protein
MPPELDADMLATLTPEERAAIEDDQPSAEELAAMQRIAAGAPADDDEDEGDGDDDGDSARAAALPVEGKGAAETPAAVVAPAATPAAASPASAAADSPDDGGAGTGTAAVAYAAQLPSDYDEKVNSLAAADADLKAKFKTGEIDFDEFEVQRGGLQQQREELTLARAKAEISQEMTQQTAQNQWKTTVERFVSAAAKEDGGIDYRKDTDKQADLDQFVKVLANRTENADKPMDWFLTEAHKRVMALHGMAPAPVAAKLSPAEAIKAANAARRPPIGAAPATLAQVPGGDGPGDVAGEFADIDALDGEALEGAIAKMTPAQREKWARGR